MAPRRLEPLLALAAAAVAALWPPLAPVAVGGLIIAALRSDGRGRLVLLLGGGLALVGAGRFAVRYAAPNIVIGGQLSGEEEALSRLREIRWAELASRRGGWIDTDGDRGGEYGLLGELLGAPGRPGVQLDNPPLGSGGFHPLGGRVWAAAGYAFTVYLPGADGRPSDGTVEPRVAAHRFVAYAWPVIAGRGGQRIFALDQDDRLCEAPNRDRFAGADRVPPPLAAISPSGPDLCCDPACAGGSADWPWRPWKGRRNPPSPSVK